LTLSTRKEIDTSPSDKGFLDDFCVYGGKLLGLPTEINAQVMLLNTTAAKKMGVKLNNLRYWDGLVIEAKKLHRQGQEILFDVA
jgi:ABC-type glycerol-3-phosphate transport system substrate-binding protein